MCALEGVEAGHSGDDFAEVLLEFLVRPESDEDDDAPIGNYRCIDQNSDHYISWCQMALEEVGSGNKFLFKLLFLLIFS